MISSLNDKAKKLKENRSNECSEFQLSIYLWFLTKKQILLTIRSTHIHTNELSVIILCNLNFSLY